MPALERYHEVDTDVDIVPDPWGLKKLIIILNSNRLVQNLLGGRQALSLSIPAPDSQAPPMLPFAPISPARLRHGGSTIVIG